MGFLKKAWAKRKTYRPFVIIFFFVAAYFISGGGREFLGRGKPFSSERAPSVEKAREFFPDAAYVYPFGEGLFRVENEYGLMLGHIAAGPPESAGVTGYAGEVPFLAVLDEDKRVKEVYMLENRETPGYAAMVSGRLKGAWEGLSPEEAYREPVEAVTGATRTSMALIEGVRKTMLAIAGDDGPELFQRPIYGRGLVSELFVLLYLAAGLWCYLLRKNSKGIRIALEAGGFFIPGVLAASLLSLALFESWLGGFILLRRHWLLLLIGFFAAGVPMVRGRNFYCFYFCPFGKAQDIMGRIKKRKIKPGGKVYSACGYARLFLIVFAFIAVVSGSGFSLSLFEPFAAFGWPYAPLFTRVLAAAFLVLAVLVRRPWCRVCPTGGILDGLKRGAG